MRGVEPLEELHYEGSPPTDEIEEERLHPFLLFRRQLASLGWDPDGHGGVLADDPNVRVAEGTADQEAPPHRHVVRIRKGPAPDRIAFEGRGEGSRESLEVGVGGDADLSRDSASHVRRRPPPPARAWRTRAHGRSARSESSTRPRWSDR